MVEESAPVMRVGAFFDPKLGLSPALTSLRFEPPLPRGSWALVRFTEQGSGSSRSVTMGDAFSVPDLMEPRSEAARGIVDLEPDTRGTFLDYAGLESLQVLVVGDALPGQRLVATGLNVRASYEGGVEEDIYTLRH